MKRFFIINILLLVFSVHTINAQSRREIQIPDIPGFLTLKCDFHMHTVFSDGKVWPTVRVNEAWELGLDAIAITDHIEVRPNSKELIADHNRSYQIAKTLADKKGIILIHGAEITRKMPPGHLNALFLTDANLLEQEDWFQACKQAKDQGAFLLWNHPGWKRQQRENTLWWPEHTRLYEAGILRGIEVYNDVADGYYPEALTWAQEKGLTIFANSDLHDPEAAIYYSAASHRPLTLVFATERKAEAIRYALEHQQTAVYIENRLIGDQKYLKPIFDASVKIRNDSSLRLEKKATKYIQVYNDSDVDFMLKGTATDVGFTYQKEVALKAHCTTSIEIKGKSDEIKNQLKLELPYEVTNLVVSPTGNLQIIIKVDNL